MSSILLATETQLPALKVAHGQHTTVAASDTVVVPGMATVLIVIPQLDDDPVAGCQAVTAVKPASGGSFTLKTWKATAAGDTAKIPATTFGKKVNWIAFGK